MAPPCSRASSLNYIDADDHASRRQTQLYISIYEETPTGILIVDEYEKIVSHNRRFLELWQIDLASLYGRPTGNAFGLHDRPLLCAVLERVEDPENFVRRVNELYEDRRAVDLCDVPLRDGRTLERNSIPLWDGDTYLGRIWFFYDVTLRKNVELVLKQAK